jgi:hypothetical protein
MSEAPNPTGEAPAGETPPVETPREDALYPEQKPEGETPPNEEAPTGEEPKPEDGEKPPEGEEEKEDEKPSLEIKLPEDFEVDKDALAQFTDLAAQAGLNQEQAQSLADVGFKLLQAQAEASAKAWETTINEWRTTIQNDPELGGDKAAAVQTVLGRALDEYGSKEAREAFDMTGAGWHPAVVKFVYKMASALSEGTAPPVGNPAPRTDGSRAERLYGNQS